MKTSPLTPGLRWEAIETLDDERWDLLCAYLENTLLNNYSDELILTALRAELLGRIVKGRTGGARLIAFLSALAIFCHDCEYVLAVSPAEMEQLARLTLGRNVAADLIIGCYRATSPEELPIAEIERASAIENSTSAAVQSMYEENPYPRWKHLNFYGTNDVAADHLIAGCGSGRHILTGAAASPRSRFVGVDLSLVSLAYGLMKAREHGIQNARFIHCDMLQIAKLGLSFDHISAVGSVHHMKNPADGVRALAGVLRPGGSMKLAVYSRTGRATVLEAIALRRELGLPASADGIRRFREVIYELPREHALKKIIKYSDFYSISGCRDLLFHVQEHNYTIADLFELIAASGLRLASFVVPDPHKDTAPTRENLARLDEANPGFAGNMFRFILARDG